MAERIRDMLPSHPSNPDLSSPDTGALAKDEAESVKRKREARELSRIRRREEARAKRLESGLARLEAVCKELGLDPNDPEVRAARTQKQLNRIADQRRRVEAIEAIEAEVVSPLDVSAVAKRHMSGGGPSPSSPPSSVEVSSVVHDALELQGTSRPEIAKLLTALNINLSIQLTRQDTANLLACLLTCNESQLYALRANMKTPVVIKTVITRLLDDMKKGDTSAVERLWDRVFGKGPMQLNAVNNPALHSGILPDPPVSRDAYLVIRENLMK